MKFEVSHRTTYRYRRPVVQSHHVVHLRPRQLPNQRVLHHSLLIEPAPASQTEITDTFGNVTSLLRIEEGHSEFVVHARSTVQVIAGPAVELDGSLAFEEVVNAGAGQDGDLDPDVLQFTCPSRHTQNSRSIHDFARASFPPGTPVLAGAMHIATRIFREFKFDPTATDISTPVLRVLEMKRGVCQDFAHLALVALRSLGLPARYVSGYLLTRPPPGQIKLRGTDASHAWFSVWAPETGWVYEDISPVSGVLLGGGDQTMSVAVDVEPVD